MLLGGPFYELLAQGGEVECGRQRVGERDPVEYSPGVEILAQEHAPLPERKTNHPLGCHKTTHPDRVVFEKLVPMLVFGCAYERIADSEMKSAAEPTRQ